MFEDVDVSRSTGGAQRVAQFGAVSIVSVFIGVSHAWRSTPTVAQVRARSGHVGTQVGEAIQWTWRRRWENAWLLDAASNTSAVRPLGGGKWSLRLDLRAWALLLAEDVIEPFVQVGFGADYE